MLKYVWRGGVTETARYVQEMKENLGVLKQWECFQGLLQDAQNGVQFEPLAPESRANIYNYSLNLLGHQRNSYKQNLMFSVYYGRYDF